MSIPSLTNDTTQVHFLGNKGKQIKDQINNTMKKRDIKSDITHNG